MSKTQGTSTTHTTDAAGLTTWTEVRSYQINVTGDSPVTGSLSYDLSIDLITITKADCRFRIRSVDDAACTRTNSSGYQTYVGGVDAAGIKTFSLTLNFTAADEDLELTMEVQENTTHGTRQIQINVQDADTWVDAPWPEAGGSKQVAIT